MLHPVEKREGADRRRRPRGGRRAGDLDGLTPLVMVVDLDPRRRELAEAILAKLRFAVAPVESVDKAVSVLATLRPEIIVARDEEAGQIRKAANGGIPIVAVGADAAVTDRLIESIRRALKPSIPEV
jgi:CheY-like chemotaxis protein